MMHGMMKDSPTVGVGKRVARKPGSSSFSAGMMAGAAVVLVVFYITDSASQWWLWLIALIVTFAVDALLGVETVREEKVKTEQRYRKK